MQPTTEAARTAPAPSLREFLERVRGACRNLERHLATYERLTDSYEQYVAAAARGERRTMPSLFVRTADSEARPVEGIIDLTEVDPGRLPIVIESLALPVYHNAVMAVGDAMQGLQAILTILSPTTAGGATAPAADGIPAITPGGSTHVDARPRSLRSSGAA